MNASERPGSSDFLPDEVRARIGLERKRHCLVTARDIRRFAQAIGETNPVHWEDRYGPVAPPLFFQSLGYEELPLERLPPDGSPIELDVPIPAQRTVGGGSEYTIHRLVKAGETVTVTSSLMSVEKKAGKSGDLYLVKVETRFTDEQDQPLASEIATYIKRQ